MGRTGEDRQRVREGGEKTGRGKMDDGDGLNP